MPDRLNSQRKTKLKSQLKFIINTLGWALLLLVAYAVTAHAQSGIHLTPVACGQSKARGVEWVSHAVIIKPMKAICDQAHKNRSGADRHEYCMASVPPLTTPGETENRSAR